MKGKALLTIERLNSKWVPYDVYTTILTGYYDYVHEEFQLLETDSLPLPDAAYKLKVGEKITVAVSWEFHYSQDYWGEHDVDLYYNRQRVIKRYKRIK